MPHPIRILILFTALLTTSVASVAYASEATGKRHLVLVSMDGFRWDFLDQYPTPAMRDLAARGVRADALIPSFPTQTFPNHYSIATGQFPQNHGIVGNVFPDPETGTWFNYKVKETVQDGRWYGGEPIWVTASKAGMNTAAFFFVGSEAEIQGIRPDRWQPYDKSITGEMRTQQVLQWLAEPEDTRPGLITLYFDEVDDHTHWSGVGSAKSIAAIARVDGYIQMLMDGIDALPYGDQISVVLVSDHGQLSTESPPEPYVLEGRFDLEGITAVDDGSFLALHFERDEPARAVQMQTQINSEWECGTAYRPEDAPASWKIGDNPRFPELLLMPEPGCDTLSSLTMLHKIKPGGHGWAPEVPEMHGIFIAAGPGLPAELRIPPLRNVDIFPLLLRQLELPLTEELQQSLDSDLELWPRLLGDLPKDLPEDLPAPVSNNAIAELSRDGVQYLLTFMGLGPGKTHLDITREAWLWRGDTLQWQAFPAVPVQSGRLAAVAVGLADRVWLIGGYTVADDGSEVSTPEVFRVNPLTQSYERRADMPLPVDDTVALPYADRYIYLVSGWHDSGNVAEVQLYDSQADRWSLATPFPGVPVFGLAGGIVGREMVLAGGVGVLGETDGKREFGAIDQAWKGVIDPADPTRIEWTKLPGTAGTGRYRMAARGSAVHRKVFFAGGTDRPYNYSGIGYDGEPAMPSGEVFAYDLETQSWLRCAGAQRAATMDHRGLLRLDDRTFITLGGLDDQQQVLRAVTPFTLGDAGKPGDGSQSECILTDSR